MAEHESAFVTRAATIGQMIGSRNQPRSTITQRDPSHVHNPGDDTGRLMWAAYDQDGAAAAVDVLVAYQEAYNAARAENGLPPLSDETIRNSLGRAVSVRASDEQIADMREEFITRRGIEHRTDKPYEDHGYQE